MSPSAFTLPEAVAHRRVTKMNYYESPRGLKAFPKFVGIGSFFSAVEEFLTIVVLRRDVASFVFTLLILFPVFLSVVFFSSKWLDRYWRTDAARELAHFCVYGLAGLMIEWFLIGLSPWSNPDANPILMLGFQLGMFAFWSTVAFVPRLFLLSHERARKARRSILRFYIPYFIFVYVVALAVPANLKFAAIILLIIAGYYAVSICCVKYFVVEFSARKRNPCLDS
jgi:hypothetical protein